MRGYARVGYLRQSSTYAATMTRLFSRMSPRRCCLFSSSCRTIKLNDCGGMGSLHFKARRGHENACRKPMADQIVVTMWKRNTIFAIITALLRQSSNFGRTKPRLEVRIACAYRFDVLAGVTRDGRWQSYVGSYASDLCPAQVQRIISVSC